MVFKIDFRRGRAILWSRKGELVEKEVDKDYSPSFYVDGDREDLFNLRIWISGKDGVEATKIEEWYTSLKDWNKSRVLRIDVSRPGRIREKAHEIISGFPRQMFRFYHVGLSPQFQYCIENRLKPLPGKIDDLERMNLSLDRRKLAEETLAGMEIDDRKIEGEEKALETLGEELEQKNPDILMIDRSRLLSLLERKVEEHGFGFSLGREGGLEKMAGENTVQSYGKTVHSPSRYNVPGRIVIDRSNSFLLDETNLEGMWDLVRRSYRPLQELAWGSIGRLLTSIEIRKAYHERDLLTQWKNWEGEDFKTMKTLHSADRGGYIFNPEPGIHREVHQADFASLFPNIMVKKNISPETVNCSCCDNSKVPELGFSICENRRGFISEVLKPLVEDRQEMKEENREKETADAIKWILVSCFGYMGHAHASYGRIDCHQAIQAFDREIMSNAKTLLEENGYSVVHGIIDSLWVKERDRKKNIRRLCEQVSEETRIKLEYEGKYDWIAFVPRKSTEAEIGTLTRYFGVKQDEGIETAGIETEQRNTCDFIAESQEEMIRELERTDLDTRKVVELVRDKSRELRQGKVEVEKLVKTRRITKPLESYKMENRGVAALKRGKENGIDYRPGQYVDYVVKDDSAESLERVRLGFEAEQGEYDPDYYIQELVRAAESILSPFRIEREEIKQRISRTKQSRL